MRTAIDTNVLSAIWGRESNAMELSQMLTSLRQRGSLVVCGAVFAESLAHPGSTEGFVQNFFVHTGVSVEFEMKNEVWPEIGRRYALYAERRRGSSTGVRNRAPENKRVLADFIIGSHALLQADQLLTLDQGRYARDFPELRLI